MKFLIAGLGSIGRRHLRNLRSIGEDDVVLLRSGKSTLPDDEIGDYLTVHSVEEALEHHPDAVIISNPTALHLDVAIPAARAGSHLLLEKPISHSMVSVDDLREAVKVGEGQVLVGFQFRYHPGLQAVARWLQAGRIGNPVSARAHWGEYLPDWHPWEDFRRSYAARANLGGGVVLTLTHPLDYMRWFFGEVSEVLGKVSRRGDWDIDVEDTAEILLTHESGVLSSVHVDYIQRPPQHTIQIIGTQGSIRWDNVDGIAHLYDAGQDRWERFSPPDDFVRNDLFLDEMKHFLQVIREGRKPVCDLEDGIEAIKIALEVKRQNG